MAAQVAAEAGTEPVRGAPGRLRAARDRRRRLGARDDRRASERPERGVRGAELARARGRRWRRTTPSSGSSGTSSAATASTRPKRGRSREGARRARRSRRGGRRDRQRRGVRALRPLPTRAGPAPLDLRPALGLPRDATATRTTSTATARTWRARSRRRRTTASARRASPTTRRSCRCACSTRYGEGDSADDRARDPLRRSLGRRRDQPLARVPRRGAGRRDPGRGRGAPAMRTAAASVVVAAAGNHDATSALWRTRRASHSVLAVGATTITGCQADYSNAGDDLDLMAPGRRRRRAQLPTASGTPRTATRIRLGRPIVQETFNANGLFSSSASRATTRARPWRARMSPRSQRL